MNGLNAQRFKGKPLKQPTYSVKEVPKCAKDLQGSSLQEVTDRDHFNDAMAEMVLLCKEAMRRLSHDKMTGKKPSKPLSLEYIADRLDVDDPIFGYFVRTESVPTIQKSPSDSKWKQGMLQGFITVTTFTNWQKTFRWDSMHDSAFSYDQRDLAKAMSSGERRYDEDGALAAALQNTVRCGDPWNEGIVWPRIAEVSLLGGLGCGKALLSLVIEKLECMKASRARNYDYLVLQATDNSIPFYESMGFVRVGAITEDPDFGQKRGAEADAFSDSTDAPSGPSETSPSPQQSEIVSSPVETYVTNVAGECPAEIGKKLNVNVWDIIFLNQYIYKDIAPRSRLLHGTSLFVPAERTTNDASDHSSRAESEEAPQWYVSRENETPKLIANMYNVSCAELVRANNERLPDLQGFSRLKEGTRIKVSHFHIHDDQHVPYCHWTFPDDSFESNVPSYMMVRKLHRRHGRAATFRPIEYSLAAKIAPCTPPDPSMFETSKVAPTPQMESRKPPKNGGRFPGEPTPPKRALSGYMIFLSEQREVLKDELAGKRANEATRIMSKLWHELAADEKAKYQAQHEQAREVYQKAMAQYKEDLAAFQKAHPELKPAADEKRTEQSNLFNKVVKLTPEGIEHAGSDHEYYFALTYIPDLQWCHLAPMHRVGTWGSDKPKCEGRPIWMLVDESEGKELDISSTFCVPVKSRAVKRTVDADREQWDVLDGVVETSCDAVSAPSKKKLGRPRKHPLPAVVAVVGPPGPGEYPVKRKRGRPRKHPLPTDVEMYGAPPSNVPPLKRKRGRPRKHPLPTDVEVYGAPPSNVPPLKRKRGRPRKHPLPTDVQVSGAPLCNVPPLKSKRDRPPKSAIEGTAVNILVKKGNSQRTENPKRGPGRPRKHPTVQTPAVLPGDVSMKKGPGRPRKHPMVESTANPQKRNQDHALTPAKPPTRSGPGRLRKQSDRPSEHRQEAVRTTRPGATPLMNKNSGRYPKLGTEVEQATLDQSPTPRAARLTRSATKPLTEPLVMKTGRMETPMVDVVESAGGRPTRKAAAAAAKAIHRLEQERSPDSVVPRGRPPTKKLHADLLRKRKRETSNEGRVLAPIIAKLDATSERPTRKAAVEANKAIRRQEEESIASSDGDESIENATPRERKKLRTDTKTSGTRDCHARKIAPIFLAANNRPSRACRVIESNRTIRRQEVEPWARSVGNESIEKATPMEKKRMRHETKTSGTRDRHSKKMAPIFRNVNKRPARTCRAN